MAIYHAHIKTFSRAKGHSAIAAAAYRAGMFLYDRKTGTRHDYRLRSGVAETRCLAPEGAPDWAFYPARLWAAAEAAERRRDATVAREFEIALPHELSSAQRSDLTTALAKALVERYQFAVQASIHAPDTKGGLNFHAHLLATTRRVGKEGIEDKTRELDGGASGKIEVEWVREMVAEKINAHLAAAEIDAQVDHRTLEAQADAAMDRGDLAAALAFTRRPTVHIGKDATALHRKGERVGRVDQNAAVVQANEDTFDTALAAFERDGRAMPVPEGHTRERAARERRGRGAGAVLLPGNSEIGLVSGLRPTESDPAARSLRTPKQRRLAAREAFEEAAQLWAEGFAHAAGVIMYATTELMGRHVARLTAHIGQTYFAGDLRELVRKLKQLKHDLSRLARRQITANQAEQLAHQAQRALEEFDERHPRPGLWSRREWSKRRARRLRAVQARTESAKRAAEVVGPEAQVVYAAQARASADALEDWSRHVLKLYPLEGDQLTSDGMPVPLVFEAPAPPPAESDTEADASGSSARPFRPRF